jgi:Chitobiase/beta-hexosaminidase C-terminal domain
LYAWHSNSSSYVRNLWYSGAFQYFPWMASRGNVAIMRANLPIGDPKALLQSFVVYSLLKGPNSFFAPGDNNGSINPASWSRMKAALGSPLTAIQISQPTSAGNGYRLFSREFEGGTVYLNWTGVTQTIALGTQHRYYDPAGNPVTNVVMPDATATYVTTAVQSLSAPRISPRYGQPAIGPLLVTIVNDTVGAEIRYTLDGSEPTASSSLYSTPFLVSSSRIVTARAFIGNQVSYPTTASYSISSSPLTVQFNQQADNGPGGSYYPVLALSAIPTGPVEVKYVVQNGTTSAGSYTFLPGQTYGILPITILANGTTAVTITDVIGAARGQNQVFRYTVIQ